MIRLIIIPKADALRTSSIYNAPLLYAQDRVEWGFPEISTRVRGGPWMILTRQIIGVRSPEYIGYGYGSAVRTSALPSFGTGSVPAGYAATLAAATLLSSNGSS